MPLLLLSRLNKGILDSHLVIEATVKGNASPIVVKALIDSGATTNFVSQLLIKELGNPEGESSEHRVSTLDGQRLRTFQLHDLEIDMTNSDGKNATVKTKLLDSDIIKFDLILGMFWLKKNNPIIN